MTNIYICIMNGHIRLTYIYMYVHFLFRSVTDHMKVPEEEESLYNII